MGAWGTAGGWLEEKGTNHFHCWMPYFIMLPVPIFLDLQETSTEGSQRTDIKIQKTLGIDELTEAEGWEQKLRLKCKKEKEKKRTNKGYLKPWDIDD